MLRLYRMLSALLAMLLVFANPPFAGADETVSIVKVEAQPLAASVARVINALEFLGAPLPEKLVADLTAASEKRDFERIQRLLDPQVSVVVNINPESRVKAEKGPATPTLTQAAYTPLLVKVINEAGVTSTLKITSPQAGNIYSGQLFTKEEKNPGRFLDVEMYTSPPMTKLLSGLAVEYQIALVASSETGKREATLAFDVGQGTQDLGFRGETPILFEVLPARRARLHITDYDGKPTTAHFTFQDAQGHIYPAKSKRLAPDFFFHNQIYRADGGEVILPPGKFTMTYGRGPEYKTQKREIVVPADSDTSIDVKLERWIEPAKYGFYSGDHHIHAAGCAHYTSPTEGVQAEDMFLHVKGEGLNVGCNLTWGPCYDYQRQFFEPGPHKISEPFTVLKYDIEVSGFGSQLLGHVCVLNLKDQTYPGSEGTSKKGWPTWTTPLMKWAHAQGAICGYAHSASGLAVNPEAATDRLIAAADASKDGALDSAEAEKALLCDPFARIDGNADGKLSRDEVIANLKAARERLPNLAIPQMDGIGAQEICVTAAQGLCDFISAMDTPRVQEWNCWYHIMNCGFPLKVSGETDFPCVSGSRVGQGRVYVQLGDIQKINFTDWCAGLAAGRSYVSDGYAHPLKFTVNGQSAGGKVDLAQAGNVKVSATVAFASEIPLGSSTGGKPTEGPDRLVELVVNGRAVASKTVPADDREHEIEFDVPVEQSSWVAIRNYPQMHTNPVNVLVGGKPIRASRSSALWCVDVIEQLWRMREKVIAENEREEADRTFKKAIEDYRKIAMEAPAGS